MCFRPAAVDLNGPIKCPKCGAEVDPSLDACPSCGAKATKAPGMPGAPGAPGVPGAPGAPKAPGAPGAPKPPCRPRHPRQVAIPFRRPPLQRRTQTPGLSLPGVLSYRAPWKRGRAEGRGAAAAWLGRGTGPDGVFQEGLWRAFPRVRPGIWYVWYEAGAQNRPLGIMHLDRPFRIVRGVLHGMRRAGAEVEPPE